MHLTYLNNAFAFATTSSTLFVKIHNSFFITKSSFCSLFSFTLFFTCFSYFK